MELFFYGVIVFVEEIFLRLLRMKKGRMKTILLIGAFAFYFSITLFLLWLLLVILLSMLGWILKLFILFLLGASLYLLAIPIVNAYLEVKS